jgi:hypothetical protein
MTMTAVPDDQVEASVISAGGRIVFATAPTVDAGGTSMRTFYATKP